MADDTTGGSSMLDAHPNLIISCFCFHPITALSGIQSLSILPARTERTLELM